MATIEPRLIHLLNESTTTPRPPNAELPSIKHLPYPHALHRPPCIPYPIEPGAGQRPDALDINCSGCQLSTCQPIPPRYPRSDDCSTASSLRNNIPPYTAGDRSFAPHVPSQDPRIVHNDSVSDNHEDVFAKKRPVKDDFPQLPQPLKKQKATTHRFPPIIVGLNQPPSNAALFPPISPRMSPRSFGDRSNTAPLNQVTSITKPQDVQCLPEEPTAQSPSGDTDRTLTGRIKRRAAKPRRKWSEEETNHLLLGVSKHGVGRWTDILEDREFKFEDRTAGDLKDRFRTCCPAELCNASKGGDGLEPAVHKNDKRPKKGLMSENILNDTDEEAEIEKSAWMQNDSDLAPKQRKSRAHRKRLEDLAELGIRGPFKKSQRRERRPFSEQDDREILLGYEKYGPHWTKIQRDPSFNLSSRQPTDLRDRLRNKYPEKFVGTEKTAMQIRDTRANNLLEPSITMAIKNSLNMPKSSLLEPQLNRSGSREDMPKWPLPSGLPEIGDPVPFQQNMPWSTDVGAGFPSGEMDISRLLLDDNQVIGEPLPTDRRGFG